MYLGRIVEFTSNLKLYSQPGHPYTEALLSSIPRPNPLVKRSKIILIGDAMDSSKVQTGCNFYHRCQYHQDVCSRIIPEMIEIDSEHWVSCHLPRN